MSDSDSSIPQKMADLAKALGAVHMQIGYFSPLNRAFERWLSVSDPDALNWDGEPNDTAKEVFAAAAKFVELVDTAEQVLNSVPVPVFETLSAFVGGKKWDMLTRRILKELQYDIGFWHDYSEHPIYLLSMLGYKDKAKYKKWQTKLSEHEEKLRERIFDLQSLTTETSVEHLQMKAKDDASRSTKSKRSTERGEGREKLIAALTKHHKYADGSCLNQEPIGNNKLAKLAEVANSTACEFIRDEFKDRKKYIATCSRLELLNAALKLLNQEYSPHILFGGNPPEEAVNPDHKTDRSRKPRGSESGRDSD